MNRSLMIPAGCCLLAFVVLLAAFHAAAGRETAPQAARADAVSLDRAPVLSASEVLRLHAAEGKPSLSSDDAKELLTTLSGEYLRPWRQYENSPRRLYSRAMPRPIPSISAEVAMSPDSTEDSFLLATIAIRTGTKSQPVACVVDRTTKRVQLFSEGQWLTQEQWLAKAPLP